MDRDAKMLLNTFSSVSKLKKESRMNVDQVLVAANNRIHDVYKTLYVSIASYLIIIIGLTVSDSGEVDLICAVLAVAIAVVQIAAGDGDLILVFGSFFTVSEALSRLNVNTVSVPQ